MDGSTTVVAVSEDGGWGKGPDIETALKKCHMAIGKRKAKTTFRLYVGGTEKDHKKIAVCNDGAIWYPSHLTSYRIGTITA